MGDKKQYLRFEEAGASDTGKTKVWNVIGSDQNVAGQIKWFGRWRGYAFFPTSDTVFEQRCMRTIADFIEARNGEHREERRSAKRRQGQT